MKPEIEPGKGSISSHERASATLIYLVKNNHKKSIFILTGLKETGLGAFYQSITPSLGRETVMMINIAELDIQSGELRRRNTIVGHSTPNKFLATQEVMKMKYPDHEVQMIPVPTWKKKEITPWIQGQPEFPKATTSLDDIATYSLGVPVLAKRMMLPGLTEDMLAQLSASYLQDIADGPLDPEQAKTLMYHLSEPLPAKTLDLLYRPKNRTDIYNNMLSMIINRENLAAKGICEEAPIFIAPESTKYYEQMLRDATGFSIDIIVPRLSPDDFNRIAQAFGNENNVYTINSATRKNLIPFNYTNTVFWHRDQAGRDRPLERYEENAMNGAFKLLREHLTQRTDSFVEGNLSSLVMHTQGNLETMKNCVFISFALETLLQQKGIPYIVNNGMIKKQYAFRPDTGHMESINTK